VSALTGSKFNMGVGVGVDVSVGVSVGHCRHIRHVMASGSRHASLLQRTVFVSSSAIVSRKQTCVR
jgi:hypothetical protein